MRDERARARTKTGRIVAHMKPVLAITMGDVNGIGPEILAKALARESVLESSRLVVLGCPRIYEKACAKTAGSPLPVPVDSLEEALKVDSGVPFFTANVEVPEYRPGVLDVRAGACAMAWLAEAVDWTLSGAVQGIVTCPINKEGIRRAGYSCQGHTDFIADRTGAPEYRMSLFADKMRIVHLTGHLSLRAALAEVKRPRIVRTVEIAHDALSQLGLERKRVAVAGLNPHAGEAGAFGNEEVEEIAPAVAQCVVAGIDCTGPYPPDTVFKRMYDGEFELVVAMYHDQGHIPLKLIAMDDGVNVTLGIPNVRTSVDHGTSYEIARKGIAREHSLIAAIRLAGQLIASRRHALQSTPK